MYISLARLVPLSNGSNLAEKFNANIIQIYKPVTLTLGQEQSHAVS